jgi:hypothetical protein
MLQGSKDKLEEITSSAGKSPYMFTVMQELLALIICSFIWVSELPFP